jgi:hypothetical protein
MDTKKYTRGPTIVPKTTITSTTAPVLLVNVKKNPIFSENEKFSYNFIERLKYFLRKEEMNLLSIQNPEVNYVIATLINRASYQNTI